MGTCYAYQQQRNKTTDKYCHSSVDRRDPSGDQKKSGFLVEHIKSSRVMAE
jgi:hypothetical protein